MHKIVSSHNVAIVSFGTASDPMKNACCALCFAPTVKTGRGENAFIQYMVLPGSFRYNFESLSFPMPGCLPMRTGWLESSEFKSREEILYNVCSGFIERFPCQDTSQCKRYELMTHIPSFYSCMCLCCFRLSGCIVCFACFPCLVSANVFLFFAMIFSTKCYLLFFFEYSLEQ